MSELAKQDDFKTALAKALVTMPTALNTYGRTYDSATLDVWLSTLRGEIGTGWIEPTCVWFCRNAKDMPAPSEFSQKANELKRQHERETREVASTQEAKRERLAMDANIRKQLEAEGVDLEGSVPISEVVKLLVGLTEKALPPRVKE